MACHPMSHAPAAEDERLSHVQTRFDDPPQTVLQSSTLSCPFSRKRRLPWHLSRNNQGRHGVELHCILIYALCLPI
jgi:hypothetical protein